MKIRTLILCAFLLIFLTSVSFAAAPVISADKQYFDIVSGLHVLSGNVHIEHNGRTVTAGQAKTNLLEVWGSGGITFTQDDIYFSGNNVYVYFPNNAAQIDGNVKFSRSGIAITADRVDFNWKNKIATFSDNVTVTQNGNTWTADTIDFNVQTNTIY